MIELPEPLLETNGDVFGHENVQGFTADQMRSYGLSCARAAMERAAQIAEITLEDVSDRSSIYGTESAAAIRAEMCKETL